MVIDSHMHLISHKMIQKILKRIKSVSPNLSKRSKSRILEESFASYMRDTSYEKMGAFWKKELKKSGITGGIFVPIANDVQGLMEFLSYLPDTFYGYSFLDNPMAKNAPKNLEQHVKKLGAKGLKLYPATQRFHAWDKKMFPLYEKAAELQIPILFHYGISTAAFSDYRYTNPIDLKTPMALFPDLNFIVAHFGSGFFREVLMLSYHTNNIYVDTSGTNNWREYTPEEMSLKSIFQKAIQTFGPERILFGTDSVVSLAGYRHAIKTEQMKIIDSLKITAKEKKGIKGENILRLLRTSTP